MLSHKLYKSNKAGFTLSEILVVIATITLLSVSANALIKGDRNEGVALKISTDFIEVKKATSLYITENGAEPCHLHNLSNSSEKSWSAKYIKTWPTSPSETKYFITHSGDQNNPTIHDYYYIGVALSPEYAQIYDRLYDDNNLEAGLFRIQNTPLTHYSLFLSNIKVTSHTHCKQ